MILGTEADLARTRELGVTAVVSLCRVGASEVRTAGVEPGKHAEVWLIDSEEPDANAHLPWTLADAARTVAALRDAGERVLLHCVHAHHRTPSVAMAYSRLRGVEVGAAERIQSVLPHPIDGRLWRTASEPEAAQLEARLDLLESMWLACVREASYPTPVEYHRARRLSAPNLTRDEVIALIGHDKAERLRAAERALNQLDLMLGADLSQYRKDSEYLRNDLLAWAAISPWKNETWKDKEWT